MRGKVEKRDRQASGGGDPKTSGVFRVGRSSSPSP